MRECDRRRKNGDGIADGARGAKILSAMGTILRAVYVVLGAAVAADAAHASPKAADVQSSVVRIYAVDTDSRGSGFIINDSGLVGTNYHVVEGATTIEVRISGQDRRVDAALQWQDPNRDLVLLLAPGLGGTPVTLSSAPLEQFDKVFSVGFPGIADYMGQDQGRASVNGGVIGNLFRDAWPHRSLALEIIQHDAAVNPGNSGGPLFDDCGAVVGVNTYAIDPKAGAGYFLASQITEFIAVLLDRRDAFNSSDADCIEQTEADTLILEHAEEAQQTADKATEIAGDVQKQIDETTKQLKGRDTRFWMMSAFMAFGLAIATVLALRKPRGRVVKAVGHIGERLSQVYRAGARDVGHVGERLSQIYRGGRTRDPRRGIAMSGFSPNGQPLKVSLAGRRFARQRHGLTIGRSPDLVDAILSDSHVSRRHLRIRWSGNGFEVEDLNSSNGTIVNGHRLEPFRRYALGTGDVVRIGKLELQVSMA